MPASDPNSRAKLSPINLGGHMDVSKNRGKTPKWMVKIRENPIKMDDLGVPLFLELHLEFPGFRD